MSQRRLPPAASRASGLRGLRWLQAWTGRQAYRPCRAIFRPADATALDAGLVPFVEKPVTVRFVKTSDAGSPFRGEALYRIVTPGAPRDLRPEHDFDFLEEHP